MNGKQYKLTIDTYSKIVNDMESGISSSLKIEEIDALLLDKYGISITPYQYDFDVVDCRKFLLFRLKHGE